MITASARKEKEIIEICGSRKIEIAFIIYNKAALQEVRKYRIIYGDLYALNTTFSTDLYFSMK